MKDNSLIISLLFSAFVLFSFKPTTSKVDHNVWNVLLKKHVDENGFVAYNDFLNDQDQLKDYLNQLSLHVPNDNWSHNEQLAYYINLYNAATIDFILKSYPIKSIKDIHKPWDSPFIKIGKENYSLGDIEHKFLREMKEPRIHFAINCASISCPKLLNEAFIASKMEEQLEKVTLDFINSDKNDISASNPKLSKIFKWYKKDFKVDMNKDLISFINRYSRLKIDLDAKVDYMEYNWNLNQK